MSLLSKGTGHVVFDVLCLMIGGLAAFEIFRGLYLVRLWARGKLDPMKYNKQIYLQRVKIFLGALALGLFWCAPLRVGIMGALAGLLLILSVVISHSAFLLRYKPIRVMRGMRLVASAAAAMVGGADLLCR